MTESRRIGKYEIIQEIGHGGFSVVYQARDVESGRVVALKVLAPHLLWDAAFTRRFRAEFETISQLRHPNIVPVYEYGEADGQPYIAMEYVSGTTLAQLLRETSGPVSLNRALHFTRQIAAALTYALRRNVVHRDVKPANILVGSDGHVKLMDFGIAKVATRTFQTTTGRIFGSPEYMSPEQAQGEELDHRSDVYSLGVVLYEMLTGSPPFTGDTPLSVMLHHCEREPPPPSVLNPALPAPVEAVVLKALAKSREERFQSAGELVHYLQRAIAGKTLAMETAPTVESVPPAPPAPSLSADLDVGYGAGFGCLRPALGILAGLSLIVVIAWALMGVFSAHPAPALPPMGTPVPTLAGTPTSTPVPPTDTPAPTPTNTPMDTPTQTPLPTATPSPAPPTDTRVPIATWTPVVIVLTPTPVPPTLPPAPTACPAGTVRLGGACATWTPPPVPTSGPDRGDRLSSSSLSEGQAWTTAADWPDGFTWEKRDEGYHITAVTHGEGLWAVVMSKGQRLNQSRLSGAHFPDGGVSRRLDDGYRITSLAYGDERWVVVMYQGTLLTEQKWHTSPSFPKDDIERDWSDGYHVTSLAYGDGNWRVVMSKGAGFTKQGWLLAEHFPKDGIEEKLDEGYAVTTLAYGDGQWAVVMSQGTGLAQYGITRRYFPADVLNDKWGEGYDVTALAYGAGKWMVVMSKKQGSP